MIQWTGKRWIISLSKNNEAKSIHEKIIASKNKQIAAYNNAKDNLKKKSSEELSRLTGGLNLPLDFKLPF